MKAFAATMNIVALENTSRKETPRDWFSLRCVLPNFLRTISTKGGPPSVSPTGQILDATAAFEQLVHQAGMIRKDNGTFAELVEHVVEVSEKVCQPRIAPEKAYGEWLNG